MNKREQWIIAIVGNSFFKRNLNKIQLRNAEYIQSQLWILSSYIFLLATC